MSEKVKELAEKRQEKYHQQAVREAITEMGRTQAVELFKKAVAESKSDIEMANRMRVQHVTAIHLLATELYNLEAMSGGSFNIKEILFSWTQETLDEYEFLKHAPAGSMEYEAVKPEAAEQPEHAPDKS